MNLPTKPGPQLPVIYEEACRALVACTTIDEAKYFSDKAEALAAWAKIHKSEQASVAAKRLKLHAYRRMGELAEELRPHIAMGGRGRGFSKGGKSVLMEEGISKGQAASMRKLATLSAPEFEQIVSLPVPPAPSRFMIMRLGGSDAWKLLTASPAFAFRGFCRREPASQFAAMMDLGEVKKCREFSLEVLEWLDEFEQHLPKGKTK